MRAEFWATVACLLVASKSFVSTAPSNSQSGELTQLKAQTVDEAVRELESLKPAENQREVSVIKSQSIRISKVNGKEERHLKTNQLYQKDGKVVARLSQKVDKEGEDTPHLKAELDIPGKNIHKVIEKDIEGDKHSVLLPFEPQARRESRMGLSRSMQYSPQDLAEYVFWTGDERGATSAVEELIQDGTLTREEAITFLEEIKRDLELIRSQYLNKYEEENSYRKDNKYPMGPELSEIRQQIKENFNKKADYQDSAPLQNLNEEYYEELLEGTKMADLMYNEYSLEEVIYQLAKIMFRQSLSRGSIEAQDALQKFTDFLENEAQSGRISRSLEKKVLDVVIASLSDVLTQYPELVEVARESLGLVPPPSHKGLHGGVGGLVNEESHRFKGKKEGTLQDSGLQGPEKKSK